MSYLILRIKIILHKLHINYYFWIFDLAIRKRFDPEIFKKRCFENLTAIRDILDKLDVPYWLTDGTLLGCYRDKDFIKNDIDVDLGVYIVDLNDNIILQCKKAGFHLLRHSGSKDFGLEYTFTRKGCNLDIFFFYKENDFVWHGAWLYGKIIKFRYPHFSLRKIMFKGQQFNAPENVEEYVRLKYGENWHTPVGKWDWARDPKNIFD